MATVPVPATAPAQAQTASPIATYFIGGASDKNKFWGVLAKTHLIRDELIFPYLRMVATTQLNAVELNQYEIQAYYGYDEVEDVFTNIKALHKRAPTLKVRLVGHSLGGWRAATLTEKLAAEGIEVALLITIDPVGAYYFARVEANEWTPPRPVANVWINILAGHTIEYTRDDLVADLGIRWNPFEDSGLRKQPTYNYTTPGSHTDIWKMMVFPGANGRCALDFLKMAN